MDKHELIELLAVKEHESWSRWMSYFLGKLQTRYVEHNSGNVANIMFNQHDLIIPAAYVEALQKQIDTPYEQLSEQEKQYDRDEVEHILPIIEEYTGGLKAECKPFTDRQKHDIKLFIDGKCTDGYLMTKLGVFEWKDAQKLIEQYEKEGKNE